MSTIDSFSDGFQDTRYLFWVWFVIVVTCVLIILAGFIGADVIRDWRLFNQLDKTTKPTPRQRR